MAAGAHYYQSQIINNCLDGGSERLLFSLTSLPSYCIFLGILLTVIRAWNNPQSPKDLIRHTIETSLVGLFLAFPFTIEYILHEPCKGPSTFKPFNLIISFTVITFLHMKIFQRSFRLSFLQVTINILIIITLLITLLLMRMLLLEQLVTTFDMLLKTEFDPLIKREDTIRDIRITYILAHLLKCLSVLAAALLLTKVRKSYSVPIKYIFIMLAISLLSFIPSLLSVP